MPRKGWGGKPRLAATRHLLCQAIEDKGFEQLIEYDRLLPLRNMARRGNRFHAPAPEGWNPESREISAIYCLVILPHHRRNRRIQRPERFYLVGVPSRHDTRKKVQASTAIRAAQVLAECIRIGMDSRREISSENALQLVLTPGFVKGNGHCGVR